MRGWTWRRCVSSYDPQEQPPPLDGALIELLDGRLTLVVLDDGRRLQVLDIAWGYDWQDEYAHVTTNCSPGAPGMTVDFFFTTDVVEVVSEEGTVLYRR